MNGTNYKDFLTDSIVEDLVVALLSVNSYPMEKTFAILPEMRKAQLVDPSAVVAMTMEHLTVSMNNSGYDRGMIVGRMADRLRDLMEAICTNRLNGLHEAIQSKDVERIKETLMAVKGVGKKVVENAILLFFSENKAT